VTRREAQPSGAESSPERERALLRELLATYRHLNQSHFKGVLAPVQLSLSAAETFLGRWLPSTRVIELSRKLVLSHPFGQVVEVLKHEMAHQFVHEVLREQEPAHGPAFRALCERLGIDARAGGLPVEVAHDANTARILERVEKLLALAQSDNQHEAEAAAAAAQRLMLKHNVAQPEGHAPSYSFRHLGRVTGRVTEWERRLGNILNQHFFVDVIWVPSFRLLEGKRGHVMEAIGSAENLDIAAYVYDFLQRTAERLWDVHKREQGLRGNRDRLTFFAGVMSGFAQKLEQQARSLKAEGLVWVPHEQLKRYTRQRHPYLRTISHAGHVRTDAFAHGQRAGREVVLHRGVTRGASGERKLLRG
jgi:predicted SprT family Zn-dependent metalloprotease